MLPSKASIAPRILLLFTDISSPGFSKLFRNKSIGLNNFFIATKSGLVLPYRLSGEMIEDILEDAESPLYGRFRKLNAECFEVEDAVKLRCFI